MREHRFSGDGFAEACLDCGQPRFCALEEQRECRPTWPEVWMNVAREIANRSSDGRLHVGAIVVPEDNTGILALGYNGDVKGGPNRSESLEPGKSGAIHAEENCLIKCPYHYPLKKHMYVTHSPCRQCCKLTVNAGVSRVVYEQAYRDLSGLDILRAAGVEVCSLSEAIALAKNG